MRIILLHGGVSGTTEARVIKGLLSYAKSSGCDVQLVNCSLVSRMWRRLIGQGTATALCKATENDLVIGHGAACKALIKAIRSIEQDLRVVFIEPHLPIDTQVPENIKHLLVIHDSDNSHIDMRSLGYSEPRQASPLVVNFNLATREIQHVSTWLWHKILRFRLAQNLKVLCNGKEKTTD